MKSFHKGLLKKTLLLAVALLAIAVFASVSLAEAADSEEIVSVFSVPGIDISTVAGGANLTVDTTVFLFEDGSYLQYMADKTNAVLLSEGHFEKGSEIDPSKPLSGLLTVNKVYRENNTYADINLTVGVNFSELKDYCLHLDSQDGTLVAAFTQAAKQKLVKADGSESYLNSIWLYYDDGSFKQYATLDDGTEVLFSVGDYTVSNGFEALDSILTLHRTQKYQDGIGLTDYNSLHDYVIGTLDFIRVYPNSES